MMLLRFWGSRLKNIFVQIPVRACRLGGHVLDLLRSIAKLEGKKLSYWPFDLVFLLLDLVGVPEIYEVVSNSFKFNLRPLTEKEIRIAHNIYADSLDYKQVWLDEAAVMGPKQGGFAYVGFNTINSYGQMSNHILIHELMHIWQFQHMGSIYIGKALWAQHSKDKYDYGGLERLREAVKNKENILTFNYEQQGDIVADYYLLINGHRPQWSDASYADFYLYEYFIDQVRNKNSKMYA